MMSSTEQNNFLILYDGREGSSAIISMLSAQKGVCVPLFEDLDLRNFEVNHPSETLTDVIDEVYLSGHYDTGKRGSNDEYETHSAIFAPGNYPIRSIGFKARLFGEANTFVPVLKSRSVTVFVLFRRNFEDLASSLYLVHHVSDALPNGAQMMDPQFKMLDMNADEKRAYQEQYARISIPANPITYSKLAKKIVANRRRVLRHASIFAEQGIKIVPIAYEDFVADRVAFVRQMLNQLGFPPDWPIMDRTKFVRVSKASSSTRLRFPRVHPAWVLYWYYRRSYGQGLAKLARLAERWAA